MDFDYVVIGASPKLILKAVELSGTATVCLVERDESLGGCWSTTALADDWPTENAGHLLEYYNNGYELFEKTFGMALRRMDPQPETGRPDGSRKLHTTRASLIGLLLKDLVSLSLLIIRVLVPGRLKVTERVRALLKFLAIFIINCGKRYIFFWKFKEIREPEGGFVAFGIHLNKLIEESGVRVIRDSVERAVKHESGWVILGSKNKILCKRLILGDSFSGIVEVGGKSLRWHTGREVENFHYIISIPRENQSRIPSYLHFPKDKIINRISRVNGPDPGKIYMLVQARTDMSTLEKPFNYGQILCKFDICVPETEVRIEKSFQRKSLSAPSAENPLQNCAGLDYVQTHGDLIRSLLA